MKGKKANEAGVRTIIQEVQLSVVDKQISVLGSCVLRLFSLEKLQDTRTMGSNGAVDHHSLGISATDNATEIDI